MSSRILIPSVYLNLSKIDDSNLIDSYNKRNFGDQPGGFCGI